MSYYPRWLITGFGKRHYFRKATLHGGRPACGWEPKPGKYGGGGAYKTLTHVLGPHESPMEDLDLFCKRCLKQWQHDREEEK